MVAGEVGVGTQTPASRAMDTETTNSLFQEDPELVSPEKLRTAVAKWGREGFFGSSP